MPNYIYNVGTPIHILLHAAGAATICMPDVLAATLEVHEACANHFTKGARKMDQHTVGQVNFAWLAPPAL